MTKLNTCLNQNPREKTKSSSLDKYAKSHSYQLVKHIFHVILKPIGASCRASGTRAAFGAMIQDRQIPRVTL